MISAGPDDTFKEGHVLVGAVIEHQGTYYQYFSGARFGCQEGGGARQIGVAHSNDLIHWVVEPEPIVKIGGADSVFPLPRSRSGLSTNSKGIPYTSITPMPMNSHLFAPTSRAGATCFSTQDSLINLPADLQATAVTSFTVTI
jgi:hypothetical protein